jgi:hypothetical protein
MSAKLNKLPMVRLTRNNHRGLKKKCKNHPLKPTLFRLVNEILERELNGAK